MLSLRCIYLCCKVLYFILSDDDIEIKSKIFNLRLVLKHILHSQDDFFRNFFSLNLSPFSIQIWFFFAPFITKLFLHVPFFSQARHVQ